MSENILFVSASEAKIKEIQRLLMRYWGIPADQLTVELRKERFVTVAQKAIVYRPVVRNERVRNFASRSIAFLEGYDWGLRKVKRAKRG